MKKTLFFILFSFGSAFSAQAQSTTVSGTVTDTGAQTWNNGTFTFQLVANPNFPNLAQYTWTGGALSETIRGSINGAGAYSQSVPSNSAISPQGSKWVVIVCPLATSSCFASANTTITGGAQTLNVTPPAIAINLQKPDQFTAAYADMEIVSAFIGGQYYNLTTQMMRDCQTVVGQACTVWANVGAGAGGPATPCGANTQIQYNDAGVCGADAGLTWNKTTGSFQASGTGATSLIATGAGLSNGFVATPTQVALSAKEVGSTMSITSDGDMSIGIQGGGTGNVRFTTPIRFLGSTSGNADIGVPAVAGTPNKINLPTATGTNGQVLTTNGGNPQQLSWTTSAATPGGAVGAVQYNNAGAFGGFGTFTAGAPNTLAFGATNLTVGAQQNIASAAGGPTIQFGTLDLVLSTFGGNFVRSDANPFRALAYNTATNCSSAASPAVCGSAAAGSVTIAAGATTVVVNTTAVTANSQIIIQEDSSLGTKLSVTCNTNFLTAPPVITARTAGTSFTISLAAAFTVNPGCFSYTLMN